MAQRIEQRRNRSTGRQRQTALCHRSLKAIGAGRHFEMAIPIVKLVTLRLCKGHECETLGSVQFQQPGQHFRVKRANV